MKRFVIAIDPGTKESGVCVVQTTDYKPVLFAKVPNEEVFDLVENVTWTCDYELVVEMVASYGMPVGREVFETCVWIGRFIESIAPPAPEDIGKLSYHYIFRQDEKLAICFDSRANDATIRQALVDRFAYGVSNHGKGTKEAPGWFYGFSSDVWSAYAVAVTWIDHERKRSRS